MRHRRLNFVSFTPGTSFDLSSNPGWSLERELLYWLLKDSWPFSFNNGTRVLHATAGIDDFRRRVNAFPQRYETFPAIAQSFAANLAGREDLRDRFAALCKAMPRAGVEVPAHLRRERNELIGALRKLLAQTCLHWLEPDLIILDEFQRFRHLLHGENESAPGVSNASHNMGSSYTTYPTLTTIGKWVYDDGGVGDSRLTKVLRYHGSGATDYTGVEYHRTYRGHLRGLEPFYHNGSSETAAGPFAVLDVDWRGNTTARAQYKSNPTWSTVLTGDGYTAYASSTATNRGTLTETSFDDLGRPFRQKSYAIDTSTGAKGSALQYDVYYDLNGQVVAVGDLTGGTANEYAYDAAGRQYQSREVLQLEATKFSSGAFNYRGPQPKPSRSSMTGGDDSVISLLHVAFDAGSNILEQHSFDMNHDDPVAGIDLSNNDDYVRETTYFWYDDEERLTTIGQYGSGDTTAGAGQWKYAAVPARPGTAPSASSDTVLVGKRSYDAASGRLSTSTDPLGRQTKTFYDDLGRSTWLAEYFDNFVPTTLSTISDGSDTSKDRVTKYEYDGLDNLTKQIAYNGSGSAAQETLYLYENSVNATWATTIIYPDSSDTTSSGTDQLKFTYNVDGSLATRTDQRGTVISYEYDSGRRLRSQHVTTLGGSTDGMIRSITRTYDSFGRVSTVSSRGSSPSDVKNQIVYTYNGLGLVTKSEQSHSGVVGGSTPSVQYAYDTSAASGIFDDDARAESVTYPNGRVLFHDFGTADGLHDRLGIAKRLRETNGTGTVLAEYSITGQGNGVLVDYQQPDLKLDLFGGTTGTYAGLDRFARTVDHRWYDYTSGTTDRARYTYGYAAGSNRTWKEDPVAAAATVDLDDLFAYDGLDRLTSADRGNLNGTKDAITTLAFAQDFGLDQLNNWATFTEDSDGNSTLDINQSRSHNDANEVTQIDSASTYVSHDAAGNMTKVPQPDSWSSAYTLTWDAWNRLVKVADGASTVAEYQYDGLNRRIVKSVYASGVHDYDEHFYLSEQNQVLEVRKDSSTSAARQYTWGSRYIDDLVLRTRDTDNNGTLDETLYALQDANWNITALADTSGAVVERFKYDPYGKSTVLDATFAADADGESDYAWDYRFTSREWDAETGLQYFRARYYHDGLGRFVGRDPLEYIDGGSLYAGYFVPNGLDPFGLQDPVCDFLDGVDAGGTMRAGSIPTETTPGMSQQEMMPIAEAVVYTGSVIIAGQPSPVVGGGGAGGIGDDIIRVGDDFGDDVVRGLRRNPPRGGCGPGRGTGGGASRGRPSIPASTPTPCPAQILGRPYSSKILRHNIQVLRGMPRGTNHAHHTVAGNDRRAALARSILQREGIDINDAANGVFLPASSPGGRGRPLQHNRVHTNVYHQYVTNRLRRAPPGTVRDVLDEIRAALRNGTCPH